MLRHTIYGGKWTEFARSLTISSGYQRVTDSGTYPLLNVYDNRDEVIVTAEFLNDKEKEHYFHG